MIVSPILCAVDASVVTKLELPEVDTPVAKALFEHLRLDPAARFFVPDSFFAECGNVFWKHVQRGNLAPSEAASKLVPFDPGDADVDALLCHVQLRGLPFRDYKSNGHIPGLR